VHKRRQGSHGKIFLRSTHASVGIPPTTFLTGLKPQKLDVHTLKGPRSCQQIKVSAEASLSTAAWLTKVPGVWRHQPSQAQPRDSPLPWLSLRILLVLSAAEEGCYSATAAALGLHSPPTYGNGNGDSHPPTPCSRAGCVEKMDYFLLCDCILPFDALDVYSFIMY